MPQPGDVVIVRFPGSRETKIRPAVVISSSDYHRHRPDVILGLLTSQIDKAVTPMDHRLQDWTQAGLNSPSAFRSYLATMSSDDVKVVGRVTDRDHVAIMACIRRALVGK